MSPVVAAPEAGSPRAHRDGREDHQAGRVGAAGINVDMAEGPCAEALRDAPWHEITVLPARWSGAGPPVAAEPQGPPVESPESTVATERTSGHTDRVIVLPDATPDERRDHGRSLRKSVPRSSHAEWTPPADRPDPVGLLVGQNADRIPWLVPVRHHRMAASPFAFFRGAAQVMALDLAHTPSTGLQAQLCGDAHLSNFGSFASPERDQVFDINDFDETLPGPWEWDLRRLATSFVLAGREIGFDDDTIRAITNRTTQAYRGAMASFAERSTLDVWYSRLTLDQILEALPRKADRARVTQFAAKARQRDSLRAASRLTEQVDGELRIRRAPPLLLPLRDLPAAWEPDQVRAEVEHSLADYRTSLADDRRRLLDRFRLVDVALKVVGVGSVGTRCLVVLLIGRDEHDPLFLQVKEATSSVLEDALPASPYPHHGQRVVEGQRLMQATSDIFLGWSQATAGHHYYWRQLHDMKGSADIAAATPRRLGGYAALCGWTLAHAHARAGDPITIAGYVGTGEVLDEAITAFAFRYGEQTEQDHAAFTEAIASGRIEAAEG